MWVRGLKLAGEGSERPADRVAPHVGAWIETRYCCNETNRDTVAPHVGAWIETRTKLTNPTYHESHPMWVRGLKLIRIIPCSQCTGSHPMWVRGLKLFLQVSFYSLHSRTPCGCVH